MKLAKWDPFRDVEDMFDRYARAMSLQMRFRYGIDKKDVKISIEDGVLTIRGERQEEKEEKGKKFHRVERCYGAFSRSFNLPQNIDENHVEANFKDGLLILQAPKKQAEKPKSIEVKVR